MCEQGSHFESQIVGQLAPVVVSEELEIDVFWRFVRKASLSLQIQTPIRLVMVVSRLCDEEDRNVVRS